MTPIAVYECARSLRREEGVLRLSGTRDLLLRRAARLAMLGALLLPAQGCAHRAVQTTNKSVAREAGDRLEQLWVEPTAIESRDLFLGPGGREDVPESGGVYRIVGYDTTGHSRGYDVEDARGRKWKVKIGEEAQSEIVVSRILWAIGYHQPATYYVKTWRMTGGGGKDKPEPARFRLDSDHKNVGSWRWGRKNPFEGKPPYHGLIIANLILNNWDFGPDQNRIYEMKDGEGPRLRFVVQDVGASLGKTRWPWGSRNDIDDFESEGFVKKVKGDRVVFHYRSRHRIMVGDISVEEVAWTCRLLSRLSDAQLRDAFRAAEYTPAMTDRYLLKIKEKIRQGASLAPDASARAHR